jgi:Bardet-Biedl syndrome 1 protein
VPPSPLVPLEAELWKQLEEANCDYVRAIEGLKSIRFDQLTGRSQELLTLQSGQIQEYVGRFAGVTPIKSSPIVCMSTLNRSSQDKSAVACPVLGTESGMIYILDPQIYTILHQVVFLETC